MTTSRSVRTPEPPAGSAEAPGFDGSVLEALVDLVARQRRLEEFRERAESRRDGVTSAVYARVIADYQSRLEALAAEAAPLKGRVRAEYQKLKGAADRLRQRLDLARLDKEELEFRRELGEIDDAEFASRAEAPSAIVQQCQSELDTLEGQSGRFLEALGQDAVEAPAAQAPRTPAVAAPSADAAETMLSVPEGFSPPSFPSPVVPTPSSNPDSGATVKLPQALLVLEQDGKSTEFRLAASNHVGRTMDNQVQLVCAGVSRRHALISLGAERLYVIKDLQSQNGTFVNGEAITEARLADGDRIKIGEADLLFRFIP